MTEEKSTGITESNVFKLLAFMVIGALLIMLGFFAGYNISEDSQRYKYYTQVETEHTRQVELMSKAEVPIYKNTTIGFGPFRYTNEEHPDPQRLTFSGPVK